ncbi:hypothetical protein PANT_7d00325 [Moesziomyces antarcticus T-34]|uniref:Uncharacterized protein n=1 Tax=Pseudozyma antarctica (strain T-34) TaxID=1151754 RepID=M9LUH0_PSEA3|nr:hypothetical protein PANT_7d00325 [Moesziomyces antarcticus T-34]
MHEEPIDRSRDLWIERKRRHEQEEAARRDELLDQRYRSSHDPSSRYSPPRQAQHEPRYAQPPPSSAIPSQSMAARQAAIPRSQLPINSNPLADEEQAMRDDPAASALKRRRLGEALDRDDRRREEPGSGGRSPPFRRADGAPHSGNRFLDERDAYADDLRSPHNPPYTSRSNGRLSPFERTAHSPASGGGPLPPMQDAHRPSVFSSSSYDDGPDHSSSMPGLARRRGDAAQAKASRLHIDTGNGSSFEAAALVKSSSGIAKSAPPQKLSFGFDSRDHPMPQDQGPREANLRPGHAAQLGQQPSPHPRPEQHQQQTPQRLVSGSREALEPFRRDEREELISHRDGRMPDMPHTANPLARQPPSSRLAVGHVPQTATLPSPAYHTTQFARGHAGGRQAYNPPPTARLPDHLRSPPASKAHFLSLFSDFYDSLHDSRTLKATLEDQIKRSNTLLQTLQSSRRVLEETVERRVREERVLWEGRVRGLEARVRELEAKTGTADYDDVPSRAANSHAEPSSKSTANASTAAAPKSAATPDAGDESSEARERARSSASAAEAKKSAAPKVDPEGDELLDD